MASSSQAAPPSASQSNKRKSDAVASQNSLASSSRATNHGAPLATQIVAEQDIDDVDDDDEADEADEVYVALPTKVVGVRYYSGMVGAGELVSVVREPTNQYDRWVSLSLLI